MCVRTYISNFWHFFLFYSAYLKLRFSSLLYAKDFSTLVWTIKHMVSKKKIMKFDFIKLHNCNNVVSEQRIQSRRMCVCVCVCVCLNKCNNNYLFY